MVPLLSVWFSLLALLSTSVVPLLPTTLQPIDELHKSNADQQCNCYQHPINVGVLVRRCDNRLYTAGNNHHCQILLGTDGIPSGTFFSLLDTLFFFAA